MDVLAGIAGSIRDAFTASPSASGSGEALDLSQFVPGKHHPALLQIWFSSSNALCSPPPSIYLHVTDDPMVPFSEGPGPGTNGGNEDVE